MRVAADGIIMMNQYGRFRNACWVLHNGREAAVVEMPLYSKGREKAPYMDAMRFMRNFRLYPKYAFLSHPHWDHCRTLPFFRRRFPGTHFVAHSSFFYAPDSCVNVSRSQARRWNVFDTVFSGDFWQGNLGGEPVYVIHAPKHSYTDLLIIFKGAMITGDWYIGDLRDCTGLVKKADKVQSINKVMYIMNALEYGVHMLFSAHGNHLFYDADFFSIMEETKITHRGRSPSLKARIIRI